MARAPVDLPFSPPDWPATRVEMWKLGRIKPYEKNPRTHPPAQIEQLARDMREDGVTMPILVDEDGVIIAGHGRLLASQKNGFEEYPVVIARGWSEERKRAVRLKDNAVALLSGWDAELIRLELGELKLGGFDIALLGLPEAQLRSWGVIQQLTIGADAVPPPAKSPMINMGDLWVLGEHRLMCGNSTSNDDVGRLMEGKRAVLFSTDPPYAVGYVGGQHPQAADKANPKRDKNWTKVYHEVSGDDLDGGDFYEAFIRVAMEVAISEKAAWYCWHSSIRAPMVERVWNVLGAFAHQQIIWVKSRAVLTHSVYLWQHEPCLMGWVRGQRPKAKTSGTTNFNTTVWTVPNSEIESDEHPTSKPTKLFTVPMEVHTQPGDICYEPFSGSGSQIIAAEIMNRRCFAMEISPTFVDVGIRRWQILTGKEAVLETTGQTYAQTLVERAKGAPSRRRKARADV